MKFIVLGCGSSMGVPRPDGFFGKCDPKNKKNYRTRCSAILKSDNLNFLFDTSPDLRSQLLNNKIDKIDSIFYSHMHADQTHGINDMRAFFINKKKPINVYADRTTSIHLKKTFNYCFVQKNSLYPPTLKLNKLKKNFVFYDNKNKIFIKPIKVKHGDIFSICYVINKKLAYISDVSSINKKDYKYFKNLDWIILDCLWYKYNPSHLNFDQSLTLLKLFSPKKAILTNLHTDLDYNELKKKLPKNIAPAYDGMKIDL
tara:strand:+ start:571 stop:1341 length:771 start_codon:yes stop_codon:yes gene_type:complete